MTVLSAFLYAIYECFYEHFAEVLGAIKSPEDGEPVIKHDPGANAVLFLGMLGTCVVLAVWPALVLAHVTGVETFEFPPAGVRITILENCFLDLLFNGFLIAGIADANALSMSSGTMFAVPVSYIVDIAAHGYTVTAGGVTGGVLLCVGFLGLQHARSVDDGGAAGHGHAFDKLDVEDSESVVINFKGATGPL
jgi:hypothetical protein